VVGKSAFTLIELIFAIVVISISVVSLPVMSQVVSKGIDSNLVQEAIFATSAKLNDAVTYSWDENSIDPALPEASSRTINTGATDCNTTEGQRPGYILQPLHRMCLSDLTIRPTAPLNLGSDAGDLDDLDDLIETDVNLFSNVGSADAYKKTYTSTITVEYASFGTVTKASQNVKKITTIISDSDDVITKLSTFSSNIGEIDYFRRTF